MSASDALLFIDANKYLDLYRMNNGKKLLESLMEQRDFIFVTQQVVREVQRNKLSVAIVFLEKALKRLEWENFNLPDHLPIGDDARCQSIREGMKRIGKQIGDVDRQVQELKIDIIKRISYSEDEVSKSLASIFSKAVPHSSEELQRARDRKELGNPPGKAGNPLGDQLSWEQILTHFEGKRRLWIITEDEDYGKFNSDKGFLNCFLYEELRRIAIDPEVHLFKSLAKGVEHFISTAGVEAEKRLTPEETQEIEREEESLVRYSEVISEGLARSTKAIAEALEKQAFQGFSQELAKSMEAIANITKFAQPDTQAFQELAKSMEAIANITKFAQPDTQVFQGLAKSMEAAKIMAEAVKSIQLSEAARQAIAESTVMSAEAMAQIAKYAQPSEETD